MAMLMETMILNQRIQGYPIFRETCISQGKYASYGLIEANSEPYTVHLCNYGMPSLLMCLYMYLCVIYI